MKRTLLIVEDQPIVVLDYQIFFEDRGYQVIFTNTGKDALEILENHSPDIALLDIKLKDDVSGIEVGKKLKDKSIPFIFISAFSDPSNLTKAKNLEPAYIFRKPVNIKAVDTIVNEILEKLI